MGHLGCITHVVYPAAAHIAVVNVQVRQGLCERTAETASQYFVTLVDPVAGQCLREKREKKKHPVGSQLPRDVSGLSVRQGPAERMAWANLIGSIKLPHGASSLAIGP